MNPNRNIEYARVGDVSLQLDLSFPKDVPNPPLVIWIHGGGWKSGSRSRPPVRRLVDYGFALASLSYRFVADATFPAQIHDCKAAVRWLRAHASQYGYDASWIAATGSSAGGYLALFLGTTGGREEFEGSVGGNESFSSDVQAVVDYFGPADFVLRGKSNPQVAYSHRAGSFALLEGVPGERLPEELERLASPTTYVSDKSPPLLIYHGTADTSVTPDQSQRMYDVYRQAGRPAELIMLPGQGHGGAAFFWGDQLRYTAKFLRNAYQDFKHA